MSRIVTGTITGTFNTGTHLDPQTLDLYGVRELISTPAHSFGTSFPAYVASNPQLTVNSSYQWGFGGAPSEKLDVYGNAKVRGQLLVTAGAGSSWGSVGAAAAAGSFMVFLRAGTSTPAGYLGTDGGGIEASGTGTHFGIRSDADLMLLAGGTIRIRALTTGHIEAGADNTQTWGSASKRWSTVYAGTGTINTSDAREKTKPVPLTAAEIDAACTLAENIGSFQFLDALAAKGSAARHHVGLTVQAAMAIMESRGLDPLRYAFICHDRWDATEVHHQASLVPHETFVDAKGNPMLVVAKPAWVEQIPAGDRYGFRSDELSLFIARGQAERLKAIMARLG